MIREVMPAKDQDALDFGCGTGLVTLRLQPLVKSITGADSSRGMLAMLEEKARKQGLKNVRARFVDFEKGGKVEGKFHLVVSSMTLHHVPDTTELLRTLSDLVLPGGILAVADLDSEDGSFHSDNTGVVHLGFDRVRLKGLFVKAGFHDVRETTAATVVREQEGGGTRKFPVFLLFGRK